jgi:hypothetical protein
LKDQHISEWSKDDRFAAITQFALLAIHL